MATASQVVSAGLKSIIVAGAEADIDSSDAQDFLFAMNNFMADLKARGTDLGYTEVDDLSDEITIPTGALRGLIANVAIEVAPEYGGSVSPELQKRARDGLKAMRRLARQVGPSAFPATLPVGSGNEGDYSWRDSYFYPNSEDEIFAEASREPYALLTMTGNTTATTISSANTGVLVAGDWTVSRAFNLVGTTAGRITYTQEDDVVVPFDVSLTVEPATATDQVISMWIAVNGTIETASRRQTQASVNLPITVPFSFSKQLEQNDYVEVYIANETSTDNLLVSAAEFRAN